MTMQYRILTFDELSTGLLYDILALRADVFVVEQNSPYMDIDGLDALALHLCLFESKKLIGYARILPPGSKFEEASVGRIVVDRTQRGKGLGRKLLKRGMEETNAYFPGAAIRIEAQYHLRHFYQSFGFVVDSDIYDWGGIDHVKMVNKSTAQIKKRPPVSREASGE